jgi:hypothetical protein
MGTWYVLFSCLNFTFSSFTIVMCDFGRLTLQMFYNSIFMGEVAKMSYISFLNLLCACVVVCYILTTYYDNFIQYLCIGCHSKVPLRLKLFTKHEVTSVFFFFSFSRLNKEIHRFFWKMAPLYLLVLLKLHPCNHGRHPSLSLVCCWSLVIQISNFIISKEV